MNAEAAPIVALEDAAKSYGAVHALKHGTIALRAGEVRALVGENGAGKSTLVKLLGGVTRLDEGRMLVEGEPVDFHSPTDARDAGIAVIYQEPTLFPDLSVAENVVMGGHPLGALRRIDRRAMHDNVQAQLDRLGVRDRLAAMALRTPADLERETGAPGGAIYGAAPHGRLATVARPGPRVRGVDGLWRTGGTVHPGGGLPLVLLGARSLAHAMGPA
jgi:hypothetical protein